MRRHTRWIFGLALAACGPDATTDETDTGDATASPDIDARDADDARPEATPLGGCVAPSSAAVANASLPPGFCAVTWATDLASPRGLFVADHGDVIVLERGRARVTVLWDDDRDGVSGAAERATLAEANGLNHGVFVHGGFLYASSATTVYRWAYTSQRSDLGTPERVVKDIPSGGHATRTVVLDAQGRLYVSVGSRDNVDDDASRARVRRFTLDDIPAGGLAFADGEVFADGLRNEVGLAFDAAGTLWGVQNGMDGLARDDLGGDIHEDNPAEILSRLDAPGAFHGYPYCWTEFRLPQGVGLGPGTMWATPGFHDDGTHSDAWCRDPNHVDPPELAMQAHAAPLDLEFYDGAMFPEDYRGDLFVTFHGSWNRDVPTGYKVVRVPMEGGVPQEPVPFFEYAGQGDVAARWPHRPVGVRVGVDGRLFVTSDASGVVIMIGHEPAP